jgi:hypothetical protein
MKHKGGRKPAFYSVEMGQWVHRNWTVNTARPADVRATWSAHDPDRRGAEDATPTRGPHDPDQPVR